ncbi:MAG: diguanylate cyclase [Nitrosomonas sp.]|nr:diguanylate cyclase [Nitrosomonas sp.]
MTRSVAEFQEKMLLLSKAFLTELPVKTKAIETAWLQFQDQKNPEVLRNAQRKVHGLESTSKIFGYRELSQTAINLECALKQVLQDNPACNGEQDQSIHQQIAAHITELNRLAAKPRQDQALNYTKKLKDAGHVDYETAVRVFVVDDDQESAQELAMQLSYYGYEVEVFGKLTKFRSAIQKNPQAIVLMNIEFSDDDHAGLRTMKEIQQKMDEPVQVIFLSSDDDLALRLEAVRAGGIAYLTKPINSTDLIDQLDSFAAPQTQEPFRVLIIDGSDAVLAYHAAILELAGMTVKTVNAADAVMKTLLEFSPDVILIDTYMPECSGIELTKVIRQIDGLLNLPIVYLSLENDFNTQQEALQLNGDDFIVKPAEPKRLISAVTLRIRRARLLRGLMVRDGLTGLFNHTAIKEQLNREIVRSNRLKTPLSFAMIDVDFFKKVNDKHGHAAGDRVLKSLARLLKQRLRGTDIVGRYGGEEFAVILTDTDAPGASRVIDEIRNVFSRLIHMSDNKEFTVTFSCGIADIKHFPDTKSISNAADKALYKAKKKGRNQVMISAD